MNNVYRSKDHPTMTKEAKRNRRDLFADVPEGRCTNCNLSLPEGFLRCCPRCILNSKGGSNTPIYQREWGARRKAGITDSLNDFVALFYQEHPNWPNEPEVDIVTNSNGLIIEVSVPELNWDAVQTKDSADVQATDVPMDIPTAKIRQEWLHYLLVSDAAKGIGVSEETIRGWIYNNWLYAFRSFSDNTHHYYGPWKIPLDTYNAFKASLQDPAFQEKLAPFIARVDRGNKFGDRTGITQTMINRRKKS